MAYLNKWIGIGNLGRDPEIKYSSSGNAVTNISIACTNKFKDKQTGENKESTEWVRVVLFGKTAEIAGEYLKKGRMVYIEGRLQTRKYQDKEGVERYSTEIVASDMQMLGGGEGRGDGGSHEHAGVRPAAASPPAKYGEADFDDDIPF